MLEVNISPTYTEYELYYGDAEGDGASLGQVRDIHLFYLRWTPDPKEFDMDYSEHDEVINPHGDG